MWHFACKSCQCLPIFVKNSLLNCCLIETLTSSTGEIGAIWMTWCDILRVKVANVWLFLLKIAYLKLLFDRNFNFEYGRNRCNLNDMVWHFACKSCQCLAIFHKNSLLNCCLIETLTSSTGETGAIWMTWRDISRVKVA